MSKYSHDFIEKYDGFMGFGMDRKSDEQTVACYLQMFSDDEMMKFIIPKMTDAELDEMFTLISRLLKSHLTEPQYHRLFLKEEHHH